MDIAFRVAQRFLNADTIGDPQDLLRKYRDRLAEYGVLEDMAKGFQAAYAELRQLFHETPMPTDKMREIRNTRLQSGGPTSPARVGMYWQTKGFTALAETARLLCMAIVQTLVLPPKLRKSIETTSKFWMRNPRLKGKGNTVEEWDASKVDAYLEDLEVFRKHEKLFELAVKEGKAHSSEGASATRLRAGPFTVVNTGGFANEVMLGKVRLVEEAAKRMEAIGLGQVCYGDVLVTNQMKASATIAAFYHPASDEMFVRAGDDDQSAVRIVCHELTHRYEHKFMGMKRDLMADVYRTINTGTFLARRDMYPDPGATVTYNGKPLVVESVDPKRKKVQLRNPSMPDRLFSMSLNAFRELLGTRSDDDLSFITPYAKRGGPSENFAEMVSFYAIGKLPKAQVDLLLPLLP